MGWCHFHWCHHLTLSSKINVTEFQGFLLQLYRFYVIGLLFFSDHNSSCNVSYLKHLVLSVHATSTVKSQTCWYHHVLFFFLIFLPTVHSLHCFAGCVHLWLCMCFSGTRVHGSECVGAATGVNTVWLRSVRVKWECSAVWSDHCETVPSNSDCLVGMTTTTVLETASSRRLCGFTVLAASTN